MIKNCIVCGKEFKTYYPRVKRCSRECYMRQHRANWKGDQATANTKRHRARAYHPLRELCDRCKVAKAKDRHHIDGNPGNNQESNIAHLCRRCHMLIDGRLAKAGKYPGIFGRAERVQGVRQWEK